MPQPILFNTPSPSLAEFEITLRRMTRGTVTAEAEVAEEVCEARGQRHIEEFRKMHIRRAACSPGKAAISLSIYLSY